MIAGAHLDGHLAPPALVGVAAAGLAGAAIAMEDRATVAIFGVLGAIALAWFARRAGLLDWWALLLVALLSANYNVFINANSFIAGGADRGRTITLIATAGLLLFALAQNELRKSQRRELRPMTMDWLVSAFMVTASGAFAHGAYLGNERQYLFGDYGQLVQFGAAYAAMRLFAVNAGPEGVRPFLVLLALTWGLRAAAELLLPETRGTAIIVLDGEQLFRRTDPLGPLALPLLAGLAFSERRRDWSLVLFGALALVALQNVLGFTRAHYVALGAATALLAVVSCWHPQGRGRLVQVAVVGGVACVVLYLSFAAFRAATVDAWARFEDSFDSRTHSRLHREAEFSAVLARVRAAPLAGHGLGAEYVGADPDTLQPTVTHFIHNDYLALWMRGGIALIASWVAVLGYAMWRGLRLGVTVDRLSAAGAGAGVFGIALTGVLSGSAFGYVAGPITALLIVVATMGEAEARAAASSPAAAARPAMEVAGAG